jgi:ABC-type branched-subunit amino acid transport system substrate-binding protein
MKKIIILATVTIILISGLYFSINKTNSETVKIGVVASLTGPGAAFGQSAVKGIELAQRDLGKTDKEYKLIIEDDGGNPAKSASAAQKLINIDKVDAIISVSSGAGNAVKPIAEEAGVPHISNSSDLSIADTKTGFLLSLMPDDEAQAWLKEAQSRNIKRIVILSQNHPGVNITMDNIKKFASEYGIEVVYEEKFDSQTRDFKTSVAKAKQFTPDVYMIAVFPPLLEIVSKELIDQGQTNISSYAMIGVSSNLEMFEGKWYTDSYLSNIDFVQKFNKNFPDVRFNVRTAPANYDALNILVDGFEKNENMLVYLGNLEKYSGESGELTQKTNSHIFRISAGIWSIQDGKAEIIK